MRYSSSMLAAVIIALLLFLGMSILVSTPKLNKSTQIEMINFTKVRDMHAPKTKPDMPKKPPKRKTVKQPPVAPNIDITSKPINRDALKLPIGVAEINKASISKFVVPTLDNPGDSMDSSRELTTIMMMQAVYPQVALHNKTEGWVQVEFVVNAQGLVTNAKVIDAKPKRIFNKAAIRAIQKSKFKPLMVNGKAMSQMAVQTIEFKIEQ